MATGLHVHLGKPYRVDVLPILLKVISADYPVQPIGKTGAQQLHLLAELFVLVDVDEVGNPDRGTVLVAFKVTFKTAQRSYRFYLEFVVELPVHGKARAPDVQFLVGRVATVIQLPVAVVDVLLVVTDRVIGILR